MDEQLQKGEAMVESRRATIIYSHACVRRNREYGNGNRALRESAYARNSFLEKLVAEPAGLTSEREGRLETCLRAIHRAVHPRLREAT